MLRFVLGLLLVQSIAWSQDNDILGLEIENNSIESQPPPKQAPKKNQNSNKLDSNSFMLSTPSAQLGGKPANVQQPMKLDDYFNTWNARKVRQSFGYSPLLNMAQYDRWITPKYGFFVGFYYQKSQDNFTETKTTNYNQTSLSLSESVTFGGSRNPTVMSLMIGGKSRIWQNDWLQINWGPLLMYTHGTSVSYATGTITRTVGNVNVPGDFTMNESALGSTSAGVDPKYSMGVKIGSEFYIKWFPNLAICGDIVFLNQMPVKGTQETSTATKTYNVVSGVAQAPTAESYSTSRTFNDLGGAASTSQVGASYFNMLGANWSIKYVW